MCTAQYLWCEFVRIWFGDFGPQVSNRCEAKLLKFRKSNSTGFDTYNADCFGKKCTATRQYRLYLAGRNKGDVTIAIFCSTFDLF